MLIFSSFLISVLVSFRQSHQRSLIQAMLSIMTLVIEEKVTQPLLGIVLQNLMKADKVFIQKKYFNALYQLWCYLFLIQDFFSF